MRVLAVDVDFRKEREGDLIIFFAECINFRLGSGLLGAELIAGKTENGESARAILFM